MRRGWIRSATRRPTGTPTRGTPTRSMPGGNYVPDPEGDAMTFLDDCIAKVEDYRNQNDSTVTVLIRFIVHLVGDMHCPGHVKYPWYKSFKFTLSGKEYGLHNYWDEWALTLSNKWHYLEYGHQLDRYRRRHAPRLAGRQRPRVPRDLRLDQGRSDAFVRGVARLHHFLVRVRRGAGAESRIQVGGAAEPLVRIRRLRPHVAPPGMPPAFRCDFRGGGASELWFVRMAVRNPSGDLKSVRDDDLKFLREAVRDLSGRWGGIPSEWQSETPSGRRPK